MESDFSSPRGIVHFLNNYLGFKLQLRDFEAPSKDLLVDVTLAVCRDLGLNDGAIEQPAFMYNVSSNVDTMLPTLPFVHTLMLMRHVFALLGVFDISSTDLLNPSPKRTRRLIRVLLEAWTRQRVVLEKFDCVQQAYIKAGEEKEMHMNALESAKTHLNQLLLHPGCQDEKRAAVLEELRATVEEKEAAEEKQAAQKENYQGLKLELQVAIAKDKEQQCTIREMKAAIQRTRSAEESDPARIQQQHREATEAVTKCLQQLSAAVADREKLKGRVELEMNMSRARTSVIESLQSVMHKAKSSREAINAFKENKACRMTEEAKYNAACKASELFREESTVAKEQMEGEKHQLLAKLAAQSKWNIEVMQQLKNTHHKENRMQEEIETRKDKLQKELAQRQASCEEMSFRMDQMEKDLWDKTQEIISDYMKYHDHFRSTCKKVQDMFKRD